MIFFLMICMCVIGGFFMVCFGKMADCPMWFILFACGTWGAFCGGLGRYIKDEKEKYRG